MTLSLAQRDAYIQRIQTEVVSCTPVDGGFAVRLAETICYATGGGQPADRGTVGEATVLDVRRDDGIVHLVDRAVDGTVNVVIDWTRRYDLMQQHSAQHLVTAIADDEFDLPTISFHLGEDYCAIEFACQEPPAESALVALATRVNEEIRAARAIQWRTVTREEYAELETVRSRGLPETHVGDVRLVEIDGLDLNTCGGTHSRNTAELQVVKLGRTEKTANGVRIHYFAGGRVLRQLEEHAKRDLAIGGLLTCSAADFAASVQKLQTENKHAAQKLRALSSELVERVAKDLACSADRVQAVHLPTDDLGLLNAVANRIGQRKLTVLLGEQVFLVAGPEDIVEEIGPRVRDLLDGRGGGRAGRFQGKHRHPDSAASLEIIRDVLTEKQP